MHFVGGIFFGNDFFIVFYCIIFIFYICFNDFEDLWMQISIRHLRFPLRFGDCFLFAFPFDQFFVSS